MKNKKRVEATTLLRIERERENAEAFFRAQKLEALKNENMRLEEMLAEIVLNNKTLLLINYDPEKFRINKNFSL